MYRKMPADRSEKRQGGGAETAGEKAPQGRISLGDGYNRSAENTLVALAETLKS
jgi:hypothetical protein